jgi:hypothetical protein
MQSGGRVYSQQTRQGPIALTKSFRVSMPCEAARISPGILATSLECDGKARIADAMLFESFPSNGAQCLFSGAGTCAVLL